MTILSLGAGVQSSTLFLKSCRGELPRLDHAIMADTRKEPAAVYEHLGWLIEQGRRAGIPVHVVSKGDLGADVLAYIEKGGRGDPSARRFASLPLFTRSAQQLPGEHGLIRRQCTREYKLDMIRKKVRELLGVAPGCSVPPDTRIEQWVGISLDEMRRVRQSTEWWVALRYPLIFDCEPPMSRAACVRWLATNYPERTVPRSACIFCPFHSDAEWRDMRDNRPLEWAEACAFDRAIRRQPDLDSEAFLHVSCVPLEDADLHDPDPRQLPLFSCGVCDT